MINGSFSIQQKEKGETNIVFTVLDKNDVDMLTVDFIAYGLDALYEPKNRNGSYESCFICSEKINIKIGPMSIHWTPKVESFYAASIASPFVEVFCIQVHTVHFVHCGFSSDYTRILYTQRVPYDIIQSLGKCGDIFPLFSEWKDSIQALSQGLSFLLNE